jgi:hypothetical protein
VRGSRHVDPVNKLQEFFNYPRRKCGLGGEKVANVMISGVKLKRPAPPPMQRLQKKKITSTFCYYYYYHCSDVCKRKLKSSTKVLLYYQETTMLLKLNPGPLRTKNM